MSEHSFILRYGPNDTHAPQFSGDDTYRLDLLPSVQKPSKQHLEHGLSHFLVALDRQGMTPSEDAFDFAVFVMGVAAADTYVNRQQFGFDAWSRKLHINVPVSDVPKWQSVRKPLEEALKFLSGDFWRLSFRPRPKYLETIVGKERQLQGLQSFDEYCLFSGGLDSLVGALDILSQNKNPLLIGQAWDHFAAEKPQNEIFEKLKMAYADNPPVLIQGKLGVKKSQIDFGNTRRVAMKEMSQRTRSIIFFAMAILATSCFQGNKRILVPENGFIALNVPLDFLRVGSASTRTVHPFLIKKLNEIFELLGFDVELENPYRFSTKREMVTDCGNSELLSELVKQTISCSSPAKYRYQRMPVSNCGHCVPCLIRRAALHPDDPTNYSKRHLGRLGGEAIGKDIKSFQYLVQKLKKSPGMEKVLVRQTGPIEESLQEYANVFKRGLSEVENLLDDANKVE